MPETLVRRLKTSLRALGFVVLLSVSHTAGAGVSCSAGLSDALKTTFSDQACTSSMVGKFYEDLKAGMSQMESLCFVGKPGEVYEPNPSLYWCASVITGTNPSFVLSSYAANFGQCSTNPSLHSRIYMSYQCTGNRCPAVAGKTTAAGGTSSTICISGCTAYKSGGFDSLVVLSSGQTLGPFSIYTVPLENGVACSNSVESFTGQISDGQGNKIQPDADRLELNNEDITDMLEAFPESGDSSCMTGVNNGSLWAVCGGPAQSPPFPDNGTPGTPAAPNFEITNQSPQLQDVQLFSQNTWASSSSGFGGSPSETPGGGNTPGSGGSGDADCIGDECNDQIGGGGDCNTPPVCSGSPIQCFNAHKLWEISCADSGGGGLTDTALTGAERDAAIDAGLSGTGALEDTSDVSSWLPTPTASACSLADVNVTLLGSIIPVKLSFICPLLGMLGAFLLIASSILSFKIVYSGIAT